MKRAYFHSIFISVFILLAKISLCQPQYQLKFNPDNYQVQTFSFKDKTFQVRVFENIVYVKNPVDTTFEIMNIYIPEEYFNGNQINGYTVETAPVFFPINIRDYLPSTPIYIQNKPGVQTQHNGEINRVKVKTNNGIPNKGIIEQESLILQVNTLLAAISRGYVVVSAGARGSTSKNKEGKFNGKAPAGIVDLKATVRYLKYNDNIMPGDANSIISIGTSAGGAMSALLGASGNHPDYEPCLKSLGAADTSDNVFAVSAYCPVTNLENADMAYEWQFNGVNVYRPGRFMIGNNHDTVALTGNQVVISKQLKNSFSNYLNGLNLKDKKGSILFLDANGNGNFKELVKSYIFVSAQRELDKGTDLSGFKFLTISKHKVIQIDFDSYVNYLGRQKAPPAFDALNLSTAENMLFGSSKTDKRHFTSFGQTHSTVDATSAERLTVKMMNPMNYIGRENSTTAKYWRISHGLKNNETGLAIPVLLTMLLENKGYIVHFTIPWEKTHSGDYDLDELLNWIDSICK